MRFLAFEHSTLAYRTDFALYGTVTLAIALVLVLGLPPGLRLEAALLVLTGLGAWTILEYGLHRLVLHRISPFRTWHAEHHRRPSAWICTPTVVSAALFLFAIYLPALVLLGPWRAAAFTLGILAGYFAYAALHHALHHGSAKNEWLRRRKHAHAHHHGPIPRPGNFGVTSSFWDHVFRTHHAVIVTRSRLATERPRGAVAMESALYRLRPGRLGAAASPSTRIQP